MRRSVFFKKSVSIKLFLQSFIKCLKNQPCGVIKMREEVGKKPKKEKDNPLFL